jgi:hypothetical protein
MSITISVSVPDELARQLPTRPAERQRVLELGLRQWRICQALEAFKRRDGSPAYAATQAMISLREMILLAYAHGLTPKVDSSWFTGGSLPLDNAATL